MKAIPTSSLTPRRLGYQPALSMSLFTEAATRVLLAQLPGYRTCCGGCHGNSRRAGTGCQPEPFSCSKGSGQGSLLLLLQLS